MPRIRLGEFCQVRSGDKANLSNIAIFAPTEETFGLLREQLTPDRVKAHLGASVHGEVKRYEAPLLRGFNFVCQDALGGGGAGTLQVDTLGKTYGMNLLRMEVDIPAEMIDRVPMLRP